MVAMGVGDQAALRTGTIGAVEFRDIACIVILYIAAARPFSEGGAPLFHLMQLPAAASAACLCGEC
jgi:hypothetical protein